MDTVSKEVRSRIMAAVRDKDTKPEIIVRKFLHSLGYRYRLHRKDLSGSPDLFLKKHNAVIFIHGCFWHQHKGCKHATIPKSNVKYWTEKLKRNVLRDKKNISLLKKQGYKVKVIWECETTNVQRLHHKLRGFLDNDTKNKMALRVIDLFCGCGGMSLGFQNAGFKIVAAFDNWEPAIKVYKKNFQHPVFHRDLKNTSGLSDLMSYKPDIIIGGPPCQDFSSAGHRNENLGRADLTISFSEIIKKIKPKYFVMENVPRIQKSDIFVTVIKKFKSLNYGLTQMVLDASLCGVPQKRKRFVLMGELGGKDDFLLGEMTKGLSKKPMTLYEYFGDSLGFEYYFRVPRSYSRRGIYSIYEPSMTVRGVDRPVPTGYPGHPADNVPIDDSIRTLTFKERSLIQTFNKKFIFEGSKTNINQMIGNAVPVKLAEYIATTLKMHIEHQNEKN